MSLLQKRMLNSFQSAMTPVNSNGIIKRTTGVAITQPATMPAHFSPFAKCSPIAPSGFGADSRERYGMSLPPQVPWVIEKLSWPTKVMPPTTVEPSPSFKRTKRCRLAPTLQTASRMRISCGVSGCFRAQAKICWRCQSRDNVCSGVCVIMPAAIRDDIGKAGLGEAG